MKRYFLIFALVCSVFANGVAAGMGILCLGSQGALQTMQALSAGTSDMPTHHQQAESGAILSGSEHCAGHAKPDTDSDHNSDHSCTNCLMHCGSALLSAVPVIAMLSPAPAVFSFKTRYFPIVESSLLKPPIVS